MSDNEHALAQKQVGEIAAHDSFSYLLLDLSLKFDVVIGI